MPGRLTEKNLEELQFVTVSIELCGILRIYVLVVGP